MWILQYPITTSVFRRVKMLEDEFTDLFLDKFSGRGDVIPFAKGRVALYAALKSSKIPDGSEILVPAYTCVVVPSAIMFAGYRPVYVDICPKTYNIDVTKLPASTNAAAMIVQHSYGIPSDMQALQGYCQTHNLMMVEDCCHSFASRYNGELCGTFGRFSFFSGQWNKFFSSGLGGFLYTESAKASYAVHAICEQIIEPFPSEDMRAAVQIWAHKKFVRPQRMSLITGLYRMLGKMGIAKGSSDAEELVGEMPIEYFAKMCPSQVKEAIAQLKVVEENIAHRQKIGAIYQQHYQAVPEDPIKETVFLRYPLRVGNKLELLELAKKKKIELGSWFDTPLHGNVAALDQFGYAQGSCPVAEQACAEIINLPTHGLITEEYAQKIIAFVDKHKK